MYQKEVNRRTLLSFVSQIFRKIFCKSKKLSYMNEFMFNLVTWSNWTMALITKFISSQINRNKTSSNENVEVFYFSHSFQHLIPLHDRHVRSFFRTNKNVYVASPRQNSQDFFSLVSMHYNRECPVRIKKQCSGLYDATRIIEEMTWSGYIQRLSSWTLGNLRVSSLAAENLS